MNKEQIKAKLIKMLVLGVLLGLIIGLVMGGYLGSYEDKQKADACMELMMFQLNVTIYSAERLNITTEELMNDFLRYKIEELLLDNYASSGGSE